MKNIKDLKEDILAKKSGNIFIFTGEEWAIKKHYINKIAEEYEALKYVDDTIEVSEYISTKSAFKKKTLYIVIQDLEFLKGSKKEFENLKIRLQNSRDGVIWTYTETPTKVFTEIFGDYITPFDIVDIEIFRELLEHDTTLNTRHIDMLYHNCKGNYGFAMIEVDKVKNYAEHEHLSLDSAFDELYMNKMLTIENEPFNCDKFMEDLLLRNDIELGKDLKCLYDVDFKDSWYNLESMINDLKIAYCILKYGKFKGSSYAYESEHLYWGRVKQIREFNIALSLDDIQRLILSLSRYDSMVKQGQITNKEVIENIFYYLI